MQIEELPIGQLLPAPYNPRKVLKAGDRGYEKLVRSLAEFSLVQPVIWNRQTGHIVGGHQRVEILRAQGATTVPCVIVDLSLAREQALNVALNNREVGSDWDIPRLSGLLAELNDLPDFDATLSGFDPRELREITLVAPFSTMEEVANDGQKTIQAKQSLLEKDALVASKPSKKSSSNASAAHSKGESIVIVTLEVEPSRWEEVRSRLDELIQQIPMPIHVRWS
ncbi:ParB domain protein nuclease [Planctopirus limnophila DSM 3776]|uniref:ParB domain protein nuclease n=1 Tax=Planctopirus limnophila (strain ATCC 43296 / DSM 3776 / IFAM 1008 / Mu 290) TaxID=521674 RepID=D5SWD7_PLAL2|nr:ParB N-terminal domain-containing protein [Planctopirus limnophila]ADG69530.1 ParB domain protein nuclease [Planctopirus limnophila DSM 3776]